MRKFYLLGLLFCCFYLQAEQPYDYSPKLVLERFFRDLFTKTTVGYVLYGQKPLSLESFPHPYETIPGTPQHFSSTQALLASNHLKNFRNKKYQIIIHDNEFMFVNKNSFFRVIKDNFLLFQYKFGTKITPKSLLQKLKDSNFSSLFKEDIALQGIVLGYGAENAISYEKGSHLKKAIATATPIPPYQTSPIPKNESETAAIMKPIREEIEDLTHYKKSPNDTLKIPFSYHKNLAKTKALIDSYKEAQAKVDTILKSQKFLDQILLRLGGNLDPQQKISFPQLQDFFSQEERAALSRLIAQSITYAFAEEISPAFFEGMKAAKTTNHLEEDKNLQFLKILRARDFFSRIQINHFFDNLDKTAQCLIPKKLYFKKIREGTSEKELTPSSHQIKARYLFKDSKGKSLHGSLPFEDPATLEVGKLVPGLAHGILGMKEGEIREVFIHPDFVYGTSSQFGNGKAIQVKIELLELTKEDPEQNFPSLKPIDVFHYAPEIPSCSAFSTLQEKHAYSCGFQTWAHYKKAFFSLDQILDEIKTTSPDPLASQNPLLLKLEWLLYR